MNGSPVFPANQINAIACFNYRKQMGTQEALTGIRDAAPFGIFPLTDSQSFCECELASATNTVELKQAL
jgi:hypothetical protein